MKRVGIICDDNLLYQKIKLAVRGIAECERVGADSIGSRAHDIYLVDTDSFPADKAEGVIRMSRRGECELGIPFSIGAPAELLKNDVRESALYTNDETRCVCLGGRSIKLTELEFSLMSLLLSERRFFSGEEILRRVWNSSAEIGIVNVYIHYLREKLEHRGERIILSARGKGYRIDEKFLPGGED